MAGGFPVGLQWAPVDDASVPSSSAGVTVTSGNINAKGNYAQIIGATTSLASWMLVTARCNNTVTQYLVDIAIGAAGSEIVVVPNLYMMSGPAASLLTFTALIPVSIPAGTRIAARCQGAGSAVTANVSIDLFPDAMGSFNPAGFIDAYNLNTSTTLATTSVDPGASANTKGSYAQLTASTTRDYRGFFLCITSNSANVSTMTLPAGTLDLAIGGAGSEQIILPDLQLYSATTSSTYTRWMPAFAGYFPIPIPAGSRVAARAQCNLTTANGRLIGVGLYGVP